MAVRFLFLAGVLVEPAWGQDLADKKQATCRSALAHLGTRNPFEVAALCRASLPGEVCREASRDLGPSPWTPEKVSAACKKFEYLWAPIGEAKDRNLQVSLAQKLAPTSDVTDVNAGLGRKCLTVSPWTPSPPGTNPFASPVYVLSSAAHATPYQPPKGQSYHPNASLVTMPPSPEGNVVKGTLQVIMASGHAFPTNPDIVDNFRAAIATAGGVEKDAVTKVNITSNATAANVTFEVECHSYINTVTTAHNYIFNTAETYRNILKNEVESKMHFLHVFVEDTYGGSQLKPVEQVDAPSLKADDGQVGMYTAAASMFAMSHIPPLPSTIPAEGVLGSVKVNLDEIVTVGTDLTFQKCLVTEVAATAQVNESRLLITSVQVTPKITHAGMISFEGEIQAFFQINSTSVSHAEAIVDRINHCDEGELGFRIWQRMTNMGGTSLHTVIITSFDAETSGQMDPTPEEDRFAMARKAARRQEPAHMAKENEKHEAKLEKEKEKETEEAERDEKKWGSREAKPSYPWTRPQAASTDKKDTLTAVEVKADGAMVKDKVLAATWASLVVAGAALCVFGALMALKVWRRRAVSRRNLLHSELLWSELHSMESPRLSRAPNPTSADEEALE